MPLHASIDYSYPRDELPVHLTTPGLHPEYNYSTFIGGILLVTRANFLATNGMSSRYWGWGREDDDFYLRLRAANLTVTRPSLTVFNATGADHTFWHNHRAERRVRDRKRFKKQRKDSLILDSSGLDTVQYSILKVRELSVDEHTCTVLDVELACNRRDTHWCSFDFQFLD
jgi:xylosylprotein 4-beta-galactosyltransferase